MPAEKKETTQEKREIRAPVRAIVEYTSKSGDLLPGAADVEAFTEGGKAHRELQSGRGGGYRAEVPLEERIEGDFCVLVVSGRADGIETGESGTVLEEIKSTTIALELLGEDDRPEHWAQAVLYGAMLAENLALEALTIRLIYVHRVTGATRTFERRYDHGELRSRWTKLTGQYLAWIDRAGRFHLTRNESLAALHFPFADFRAGQREMAERVYRAIRSSGTLYLQAPTGIGKTMGVLYPAVKALGFGVIGKIFYLTAKTMTRTVAEDGVRRLLEAGASIKSVTLTAKAKICFLRDEYPGDRPPCDPAICRFAKGYFSRINDALSDVFDESFVTRPVVERYAMKHTVCPFELSLDISLWADIVIGDYNYVFDPSVRLKRFFDRGKTDCCFLVDEAHNLVDRGRSMFSAAIDKRSVLRARRLLTERVPTLAKAANRINSALLELKRGLAEPVDDDPDTATIWSSTYPDQPSVQWFARAEAPAALLEPVTEYLREAETAFRRGLPIAPEAADLYFDLLAFSRALEWYSPSFMTTFRASKQGLEVTLACIDPSTLLREVLAKGRSAVFFSATLEPIRYFVSLLSGDLEVDTVSLDSPFPPEHLCLLIDPTISTKYRARGSSYDAIASRIDTITSHPGNYLVFFPSYAYGEAVRLRFAMRRRDRPVEILVQRPGMGEAEREEFLARFTTEGSGTLVAFAVMGGIFAEGIDLEGDRLSGAIVVGPGLPQVGPERDLIRRYYDERGGRGFDYAYTFPGFNRVQQAAGRVIRTVNDRGVVLLIDDRFAEERYRELYPPEWHHALYLDDDTDLPAIITTFHGETSGDSESAGR